MKRSEHLPPYIWFLYQLSVESTQQSYEKFQLSFGSTSSFKEKKEYIRISRSTSACSLEIAKASQIHFLHSL